MKTASRILAAAMAVVGLAPAAVLAQTFPSRPITIITSFAPGAAPDVVVRAIAQEITRDTGAAVVVEGRPGGATFLAAQPVARAQPDGHTLLVTGSSTFTSNRFLFKKLPYDPVKDFQPITPLGRSPLLLVSSPTLGPRGMAELLAQARQNPGKFTFGDASGTTRVAGELLQRKAAIQLTRVPYKSTTQAMPDLMSGQIDLMFTDLTAMRLVKEGKLRALAVADSQRSPLAPGVPTLEELGVHDMEAVGFKLLMAAPAGTPPAVVEKLRAMVTKAGQSTQVQPTYATGGMLPFFSTPAEMSTAIESESRMWGEMVKAAGIEPQ